jgi:hypothetical protein
VGYYVHHTIVVTGWKPEALIAAHIFAQQTGAQVSSIVKSAMNGWGSFFVAPDGSKEGWADSEKGDTSRAQIKRWLRTDKSGSLRWYEVAWPEDGVPRINGHQYDDESETNH